MMTDRFADQQSISQSSAYSIAQLLDLVRHYMTPGEVEQVLKAFQLALETCRGVNGIRPIPPLEHALAVTTILAQMMHIDVVGISAGLVFEAVDAELLPLERVEQTLGTPTARVVGSMLRLNILERKKQSASFAGLQNTQLIAAKKGYDERDEGGGAGSAESKKPRIREALRRQQAET